MNHVVLIGRLTKDPELRYIPGTGTPVATFTLAIDREYTKKDGTKETDFIPIEVIGKSEKPYVESHQDGQPSFEPTQGLDPNGFQAIDDEDIPF